MLKKIFTLTISVLFLVVLSSCEKVAPPENGLLYNEPCGPPCFLDITPQISTKQDVNESLKRFGLNNRCILKNGKGMENINIVECKHPRIKIGIDEAQDIVNSIEFQPDSTISIGSIINKYGEPDFITCFPTNTTSEEPTSKLMIFFQTESMVINIEHINGYIVDITEDTVIDSVIYSESLISIQEKSSYRQQWKGYSEYPTWP